MAEEKWPALSVDKTSPPNLSIAASKEKRVRVEGS
jgi:hypothetical protein